MAEQGKVISCHSVDHWYQHLNHGKETKKLVVVDFTATWCGPCRVMAPIFSEFANKYTNVIFLKVDVDELREVAVEQQIEAMPTFIFLKDGEEVERFVGARKEELLAAIIKHSAEA